MMTILAAWVVASVVWVWAWGRMQNCVNPVEPGHYD
jgi:hypothetical protein